jgi:hypothetical protein
MALPHLNNIFRRDEVKEPSPARYPHINPLLNAPGHAEYQKKICYPEVPGSFPAIAIRENLFLC